MALFRLLFTRLTLPHVKKPLVWTTEAASQMCSRSLTDVSDEFTDKKVLLVFSWGKCERDDCGLIHLRRPLHLNRFCRFPKNVDAGVVYRSNGGDVISAGTEIIEKRDAVLVADCCLDSRSVL